MHDIRYALRNFRRSPGVVVTVILTIGLALGLNTTIFTIFNAYVLRPFEIRDPYSLYNLFWITKRGFSAVSFAEFEQIQKRIPAVESAMLTENLISTIEGQPLVGQRVSDNYFSNLGVTAAMGRTIEPGDPQSMILSYGAWKAKYGADPKILGRTFAIRGKPYTVVGIARAGFEGVSAAPVDFWIPLGADRPPALQGTLLRIKPAVSIREARAELDVIAAQITAERPPEQRAIGVSLISNATPLSLTRGANYALFAPIFVAFGLVLLIACANIANVLLARAAGRQKEMGVRLALGAGRQRIIRQLLVESAVLAIPAAATAFAIAQISTRTALQLYFATVPSFVGRLVRILPLEPDVRVFGFLLAAALVATLAFGLAPAIQAARSDIALVARGESGGFRPSRLRNALVVSQVAVCALLLIVSGILLRGSSDLEKFNPGFNTRNIIDLELLNATDVRTVEKLKLESWVESAATTTHAPLTTYRSLAIGPLDAPTFRSGYNFVSPEFFDVLHVPISRGRGFTIDEANASAPVAIVSEAAAKHFWPGRDPIGQIIRIEPQPLVDRGELPEFRRAQIIGVVRDIATGDISSGTDPTMFYFPTSAKNPFVKTIVVRMKQDTESARRAMSDTLERLIPGGARLAYSFDEILALQVFPFKVSFAVAAFLGLLALALAVSGVYGVLAYLVAQRRREIGIRMALGASAGSVIRLVLAQCMRFATWGVAIGVVLALGVSKLFATLLEEINTYEPLAYAAGVTAVLIAAMCAAFVPSRRAAQIDPSSTLRQD